MSRAYKWLGHRRIFPDVLAFTIGLGIAWIQGWKTTDLVWSLWISSLVLGYLTILSFITAGVYIGIKLISHKEFPGKYRLRAILIGSGVALFFVGFFSLHFCGFHAAHAGFLSGFFPVEGLRDRVFFDAFMNPILLWKTVSLHLLPVYGVFLIPVIIAERRYVFAPIAKAIAAVHEGIHRKNVQEMMQSDPGRKEALQGPFLHPYVNVIRMHILIFFFAICHLLKLESFFVFAVVYFVYFFPWKAFRNDASRKELP